MQHLDVFRSAVVVADHFMQNMKAAQITQPDERWVKLGPVIWRSRILTRKELETIAGDLTRTDMIEILQLFIVVLPSASISVEMNGVRIALKPPHKQLKDAIEYIKQAYNRNFAAELDFCGKTE